MAAPRAGPPAWLLTRWALGQVAADPAARAAALAHRHGLRLIAAPALSLTRVLAPGDGGPRWRRFLDLGVVAATARDADVFEVQAQSLARDTGSYAGFVRAAAAQARAAHPGIQVLAGLSTNPPGAPVTLGQLTAAVRATRQAVDGYWLNIPRPGRHCPACNPPRPDLGVALLRQYV